MSTTIETLKADIDALQTAHDANVAARLATIAAKDNVQKVTVTEQAIVDGATVHKAEATFAAQAKETVAQAAEAVAAALLASALERLNTDIADFSSLPQAGQGIPGPPGTPGPPGPQGEPGRSAARTTG